MASCLFAAQNLSSPRRLKVFLGARGQTDILALLSEHLASAQVGSNDFHPGTAAFDGRMTVVCARNAAARGQVYHSDVVILLQYYRTNLVTSTSSQYEVYKLDATVCSIPITL